MLDPSLTADRLAEEELFGKSVANLDSENQGLILPSLTVMSDSCTARQTFSNFLLLQVGAQNTGTRK